MKKRKKKQRKKLNIKKTLLCLKGCADMICMLRPYLYHAELVLGTNKPSHGLP
jgi:hypothetical protein